MRNKLVSVVGVNPPADIASGRIAEVRRRSMSCNCMTRTSQQECRGILELKCHRQREWKYILTSNCRNVEQLRSKKGSTFKVCCKVTLFPVLFLPVDGQRQSGSVWQRRHLPPAPLSYSSHLGQQLHKRQWSADCLWPG